MSRPTRGEHLWTRSWTAERRGQRGPLHPLAFCGRDATFLELLDHPATLPLVIDALGPNVFMYHCHLDVHPPEPSDVPLPWMWHQDGGVVNRDLEGTPRPRLSVKVAYFLTDVSEPGRGNFVLLPGSHRANAIERPPDDDNALPGARPLLASAGDAVVFDRRVWHMRSPNRSTLTRKALFCVHLPVGSPTRRPPRASGSRASDHAGPRAAARRGAAIDRFLDAGRDRPSAPRLPGSAQISQLR